MSLQMSGNKNCENEILFLLSLSLLSHDFRFSVSLLLSVLIIIISLQPFTKDFYGPSNKLTHPLSSLLSTHFHERWFQTIPSQKVNYEMIPDTKDEGMEEEEMKMYEK